ncbi:hypothetical protein EVAR_103440_1 [Eumeta japonica]|uniref:Uncharacterized protein n=1 Tax=Eumeta variegata TaxID=151549 RepID=A0A4C1Z6I2_EUMVA|nr:hypothetical protein EVAR_103440_1 [Eumeta japonica]
MFYVNRQPPIAAVNLNKTTYALRVPRNPRYGYAHPVINTDVSTTHVAACTEKAERTVPVTLNCVRMQCAFNIRNSPTLPFLRVSPCYAFMTNFTAAEFSAPEPQPRCTAHCVQGKQAA